MKLNPPSPFLQTQSSGELKVCAMGCRLKVRPALEESKRGSLVWFRFGMLYLSGLGFCTALTEASLAPTTLSPKQPLNSGTRLEGSGSFSARLEAQVMTGMTSTTARLTTCEALDTWRASPTPINLHQIPRDSCRPSRSGDGIWVPSSCK